MKIIDNFVSFGDFKELQKFMLSLDFPWFYNDCKSLQNDGHFQFTHMFYQFNFPQSDFVSILKPVLDQLHLQTDLYSLIKIKSNLVTKTPTIIEYGYHIDLPDLKDYHTAKTAILYMNTNNGYTRFEDGSIVESVENRLVVFDSRIKHAGTSCTDQKTRVVINFNFF